MSLDADLHALAGLTALLLGAGALLRGPRLARNRIFAGLCAALAIWNLGVAVPVLLGRPARELRVLYLLGGCLAPSFALHFAADAALARGRLRLTLVAGGHAIALGLWVAAAVGDRGEGAGWSEAAIALLGLLLLMTLGLLLRRIARLPSGPARTAHAWLLATAAVAAAAGLSDLLPRDEWPRLGPLFLLPFLFVLCGVVLRHRFLDLDDFLARSTAIGLGAAIASLLVLGSIRLAGGPRLLPVFTACLVVLAAAGPLGARLLRRTRRLLRAASPDARRLEEATRRIGAAERPAELWAELDSARAELGEAIGLAVHARTAGGGFAPAAVLGPGERPPGFAADSELAALLREDGAALTPRLLEERRRTAAPAQAARLAAAAGELARLGGGLVTPVLRGDELAGWLGFHGLEDARVTAELAAAAQSLGHRVFATLESLEAREAARRAAALAAVGELAAGLAHEVRNPLAAIRGAAQVLAEARDPGQEKEMLEVLDDETARLGRVVGEFLDYARPGSSRREPVAVEPLLRSVLREAATGLGLRSELDVAAGTPPLLGDPDQLHRAFGNLARNAREAAGPDGLLRLSAAAAGEGMISLRFEDDGPGILPEETDRVFQPFHTTRDGGTGLGLALVQRIVEAHGGSVELEPRPGLGAAFTVRLPAAREAS